MRCLFGLAILAALVSSGCGEDPFATGPTRSAAPEALGISVDTVETAGKPVASQQAAKTEAPKPQPQPQPEPQPQPQPRLEKAQAGASGKGNYGAGILTTPLSVYFRAQERIIFDQVAHALNLYKAANGRAPKSHEEFMSQVIKANMINLPTLRPGDEYFYDPQKEELFVLKKQ